MDLANSFFFIVLVLTSSVSVFQPKENENLTYSHFPSLSHGTLVPDDQYYTINRPQEKFNFVDYKFCVVIFIYLFQIYFHSCLCTFTENCLRVLLWSIFPICILEDGLFFFLHLMYSLTGIEVQILLLFSTRILKTLLSFDI